MNRRRSSPLGIVVVLIAVGITFWQSSRRSGSPPPSAGTPPRAESRREPRQSAPRAPKTASVDARTDAQMLLGNPDGATPDPGNRTRYLIRRPQYALSYNDDWRFPNWVSWRVGREDIGTLDRGDFAPDPDLPDGFTRITPRDYTNTGYDRGHNCPSKDRTVRPEDNEAVFFMTNMTPQLHGMNAGAWENLERYTRELVADGNECYVVCGHGFDRGEPGRRVGPRKIAVPDFGWKVVVVLPEADGDDLARIDAGTRVIAVKMPNARGLDRDPWDKYVVPAAEIERATGLRLFDALPEKVATALKAKIDDGASGSFSSSSRSGAARRSGRGQGSFGR